MEGLWVLPLSLSKQNFKEKSLRIAVGGLREKKQVMSKHYYEKVQALEEAWRRVCTATKKITCHWYGWCWWAIPRTGFLWSLRQICSRDQRSCLETRAVTRAVRLPSSASKWSSY